MALNMMYRILLSLWHSGLLSFLIAETFLFFVFSVTYFARLLHALIPLIYFLGNLVTALCMPEVDSFLHSQYYRHLTGTCSWCIPDVKAVLEYTISYGTRNCNWFSVVCNHLRYCIFDSYKERKTHCITYKQRCSKIKNLKIKKMRKTNRTIEDCDILDGSK